MNNFLCNTIRATRRPEPVVPQSCPVDAPDTSFLVRGSDNVAIPLSRNWTDFRMLRERTYHGTVSIFSSLSWFGEPKPM